MLKDYARALRRNQTDAETALWRSLRNRTLGCKYRRQKPIGPYIVDFVCIQHRLLIELDGGQHFESASDALRDQWFASHEYRVMRFWNHDVLGNLEGVLEQIQRSSSSP